mmetsp:Transcript_39319/g.93154  ORF Transcript_39319/g.93154 Transcript_39319/m.93154 type:complete len:265 (-) Transcript_39319:1424-2218(-)
MGAADARVERPAGGSRGGRLGAERPRGPPPPEVVRGDAEGALRALGHKEHHQRPPHPGEAPTHVGRQLAEADAAQKGPEQLPAEEGRVVLRDEDAVVRDVEPEEALANHRLGRHGAHPRVQPGIVREEPRRRAGDHAGDDSADQPDRHATPKDEHDGGLALRVRLAAREEHQRGLLEGRGRLGAEAPQGPHRLVRGNAQHREGRRTELDHPVAEVAAEVNKRERPRDGLEALHLLPGQRVQAGQHLAAAEQRPHRQGNLQHLSS